MLQFPIFEANQPFSLNYGAVGTILGHEFAHGFTEEGRQFDENGHLKN